MGEENGLEAGQYLRRGQEGEHLAEGKHESDALPRVEAAGHHGPVDHIDDLVSVGPHAVGTVAGDVLQGHRGRQAEQQRTILLFENKTNKMLLPTEPRYLYSFRIDLGGHPSTAELFIIRLGNCFRRYGIIARIFLASTRAADPVHFRPDPDPANQNFKNRIRILLALTKNQFKNLILF